MTPGLRARDAIDEIAGLTAHDRAFSEHGDPEVEIVAVAIRAAIAEERERCALIAMRWAEQVNDPFAFKAIAQEIREGKE